MRLIDADQFGVVSFQGKSEDFIENEDFIKGVLFILDKIYEAPTVERPHGEWITVKREFDGVKGKFMAEYCACSNCGWDNEHWQTQWVACPNCGASMKKDGE